MITLLVMALVAVAAAALAWAYQKRLRPAPTAVRGEPPTHLDRADFRSPDAPWLVAVFTSATCSSCAAVWNELSAHESAVAVTQNVEVGADPELHERYSIEDVPTAVLVNRTGAVEHAVVGPLGVEDRAMITQLLHSAR